MMPGMDGERTTAVLRLQEISDAVGGTGWRLVLGELRAAVPVGSLADAVRVADRLAAVAGAEAESVRLDLRPEQVLVSVRAPAATRVSARDVELAGRLAAAVAELGLRLDASAAGGQRSAQVLEIAVDALDIAAVRPFWRAVLGYGDEAGRSGPEDPLVDPLGQGPAVWFQQMDAPRPQRNRIHVDVSVPHDEAEGRIAAVLAAGGTVLDDEAAPAFWVLADPEGNEVCITTWQGRDPAP
jgi:4a-hydroxytetrahydrobiopterin dehydratase